MPLLWGSRKKGSAVKSLVPVLISHPSMLFRDGLRQILSKTQFKIIDASAEVDDAALERVADAPIGMWIIGTEDSEADVEHYLCRARAKAPGLKVVILNRSRSIARALPALQAGASGYLDQEMDSVRLVKALELIALGDTVMPGQLFVGTTFGVEDRHSRGTQTSPPGNVVNRSDLRDNAGGDEAARNTGGRTNGAHRNGAHANSGSRGGPQEHAALSHRSLSHRSHGGHTVHANGVSEKTAAVAPHTKPEQRSDRDPTISAEVGSRTPVLVRGAGLARPTAAAAREVASREAYYDVVDHDHDMANKDGEADAASGDGVSGSSREAAVLRCLSKRERAILRLLTEGSSNKVIARRLVITEATVKVHIKSCLRKLRLQNRTQAAMWATKNLQDEVVPTTMTAPTSSGYHTDEL